MAGSLKVKDFSKKKTQNKEESRFENPKETKTRCVSSDPNEIFHTKILLLQKNKQR